MPRVSDEEGYVVTVGNKEFLISWDKMKFLERGLQKREDTSQSLSDMKGTLAPKSFMTVLFVLNNHGLKSQSKRSQVVLCVAAPFS